MVLKMYDVILPYSRLLPMGIIVALDQPPTYNAKGSLFWDDGVSFGKALCIA